MSDTEDPRIVYSALCTWWAPIADAGQTGNGLPCCPHCESPLFEAATRADFEAGMHDRDRTHPGHAARVASWEGRCNRTGGWSAANHAPPAEEPRP